MPRMFKDLSIFMQVVVLLLLYAFLYMPILYIVYVSAQADAIWPFPPHWTGEHYVNLWHNTDYHTGARNSLIIGIGTGAIASVLATMGAVGILKYRLKGSKIIAALFLSPLFIAHILIGISSLMFNKTLLGLPGNIFSAIIANATYATAFAFLVVLAQLARYDWRLDEAAMVFGATPRRTFREVTLPLVWPAIFGAFIVSFLLAFNNLEISFYNLGATPTLPTLAWGSLRHGISQELYALAALINAAVFAFLGLLYVLLRVGVIRLSFKD
ncbi:MAG TPA: ABC transporter permease [Rhodobacterales bacterium]|nr:ABC transporter permease [Rhodobacterales bacterium]